MVGSIGGKGRGRGGGSGCGAIGGGDVCGSSNPFEMWPEFKWCSFVVVVIVTER